MRPDPRLLVPFLLVAAFQTASTETLTVDDDGSADFTSIQAAIDAAMPGADEVLVACGTYVENVVMRDGVTVRGAGARCTAIDPAFDDRPVVELTAVGPETTFSGFTVHNRQSNRLGSSGIAVFDGAPVITRNVIEGEGALGYTGSGIVINGTGDTANPLIAYNVIRGNHQCCTGGGIQSFGGSPVVRGNLIVDNASYYGGGFMNEGGQPLIEHNTIVENRGWLGGGLLFSGLEAPVLRGNIVGFNTAEIYGGGLTDWAPFEASNNDFFGNQPEDYSGVNVTGVDGNLTVDPRFVDRAAGDVAGFGLRSSSPLIDRGSLPAASAVDLRGVPRALDGDLDGKARLDLGARENEGITGLTVERDLLAWDSGLQLPELYDLFRGDLRLLREGGPYTQDPAIVAAARHACGVDNRAIDADVPAAGDAFFYLVAAASDLVPGTLGFDSDLGERLRTLPCTDD